MSSDCPWWARVLRSNYFVGFCILLSVLGVGGLIASFVFPPAPVPDMSPDTVTESLPSSIIDWSWDDWDMGKEWDVLIETLKREEGFRARPYADIRGFETFGYGTRLPITVADRRCVSLSADLSTGITTALALCLLRSRLVSYHLEIQKRWDPYIRQVPPVQMALLDMCYQLGVDGLLGFHKMLSALQRKDYPEAIREAVSSAWDAETPSRVDRVVSVFRSQEKGQSRD